MFLGEVRLEVISAGTFWMDGGAHFGLVPRPLWERVVTPDDLHRVPMAQNCLLIDSQGKRILVDTGLGDKLSPKRRERFRLEGPGLLEALESKGVAPKEVDIVVNTHLHADHCGGNTLIDEEGLLQPTFPRAAYWVQEEEWEAALHPNERTCATYLEENIAPLEGRLHLLRGDTFLTSDVRCVITPGHTPSHQSVIIDSSGQKAIYLGDLAPWAINMERLAWVPAADVEPLESIETKRRIRQWALEEEALLIFEHDPSIVAGYLRQGGDGFRVEAVEI